jgi:hypothetical protein
MTKSPMTKTPQPIENTSIKCYLLANRPILGNSITKWIFFL